jgi:RNA recognition motif-containing protein
MSGANMNIYVGNLSLDVTEDELQLEFMAFGDVASVTIMNDRYIGSGQLRGYAFVEMASKSEGQAAIMHLEGKRIRGRMINVVEALPLSDNKDYKVVINNRRTNRLGGRARKRG